jgi:hypothetical protein
MMKVNNTVVYTKFLEIKITEAVVVSLVEWAVRSEKENFVDGSEEDPQPKERAHITAQYDMRLNKVQLQRDKLNIGQLSLRFGLY